jgi:hypothetical protein
MPYWEDDDDGEDEPQEQATPTVVLDVPGPCCACGKPDCTNGCFRCGRPVCYDLSDYFADTACGGWILDTWHPEHPSENEYYCQNCLKGE